MVIGGEICAAKEPRKKTLVRLDGRLRGVAVVIVVAFPLTALDKRVRPSLRGLNQAFNRRRRLLVVFRSIARGVQQLRKVVAERHAIAGRT